MLEREHPAALAGIHTQLVAAHLAVDLEQGFAAVPPEFPLLAPPPEAEPGMLTCAAVVAGGEA